MDSRDEPSAPALPAAEIIRPRNTLLRKVARGRGLTRRQMAGAADVGLKALLGDYVAGMRGDLERLDAAFRSWRPHDSDPPAATRDVLHRLAHDLGGLGGTLGYPLVSRIARSLARLLERVPPRHPRLRAAVGRHIAALRLVVTREITGDGGAPGQRLATALAVMVDTIAGPEPPAPARRAGNAPDALPESAAAGTEPPDGTGAAEAGAPAPDRKKGRRAAAGSGR